MNVERLVEMVNDIANFFHSEPDHAAAVAGIAGHLRKFWEPRMRKQILAHLDAGGHGLGDLAREGVEELARMQKAAA
jgi:formate dehydrogenase subunit delta